MIKSLTKLLIGSLLLYLAAHLARIHYFGDIVPVGFEQEPQVGWRVQFAFILMSTEMIAIGVGCLVTIFFAGVALLGFKKQLASKSDERFSRGHVRCADGKVLQFENSLGRDRNNRR